MEGIKIDRLKVDPDLDSSSHFDIARRLPDEFQITHQTSMLLGEQCSRTYNSGGEYWNARFYFRPMNRCLLWRSNKLYRLNSLLGWKNRGKTYDDYQKELPLSDVAQNFRDTFCIAKELGIHHA